MLRSSNKRLNTKFLKASRRFIKNLIISKRLSIKRIIKNGPRYFVAEITYKKKRALFKVCLYTPSTDFLTNEKFSREILFLRFISQSSHTAIRRAVPALYASGVAPRAWYIREYIQGKPQNVEGGNVTIKKSFFTYKNVDWLISVFASLQEVTPRELSPAFKRLLYQPEFKSQILKFINPHWKRVNRVLKVPRASHVLRRYFLNHIGVYNRSPRVLVHQEPYGVHFIKQKNSIRTIDWENISWGNSAHDMAVVWMRASKHPRWQEILHQRTAKKSAYDNFQQLWELEIIMQSVFNIIGWHFYPKKADMAALFSFSKKQVNQFLKTH